PVLSPSQSNDLKVLGVESIKNLVENLQRELADKYPYLEDTITSQNGIGVLNYLDTIYSNGPDEAMLEAIRKTVREDKYRDLFLRNAEDNIDGDDEETDDEEAGSDYEQPNNILSDDNNGLADNNNDSLLELRSKNVYLRDTDPLSPPSSPMVDEYAGCMGDAFVDSLNRLTED
ncbi:hypothetical protein BGZ47_004497, partial [Haplosporangium gracile]